MKYPLGVNRAEASRWKVILAFGLVYVFWGSTYLGIDIAVQSIPPALMCAVRFAIAGVIMLAVCGLTGRKVFYSPRQIVLASTVGVLLLMGGNLTLSYAELSVSTGLAALIIAVTPLWFLVLDSMLLGHHRIAGRGKAGLALGVVGLLVLFYPELTSETAMDGKSSGHRLVCWEDRSVGLLVPCCRSGGRRGWIPSAPRAGRSQRRQSRILSSLYSREIFPAWFGPAGVSGRSVT